MNHSDHLLTTGLSEQEAAQRLKAEGFNELPSDHGRSIVKIILEVLREPMFLMLLAASVIYFLIGSPHEAVFLSLFATFSVTIAIVQEVRSENVLNALKNLTSPRALVLRNGERKRIPGREVVRGDVIFLGEGDRIPADGYLVEGNDVMADESLLTGESAPVRKKPGITVSDQSDKAGGDDLPYIFSGSLIVRGFGRAIVSATGIHSQIGRIGVTLQSMESEAPHLQKETGRIAHTFGILGIGLSIVAVIAYGLLRGGWLNALLSGIALGMSLLPEEFPLVLTVFMVMGAWRISKARVLTRRASAIETLGAATVLCTDKTGTLTENRMSVVELDPVTCTKDDLLRIAALASKPETFDPMDAAIFNFATQNEIALSPGTLMRQYGLQPELLAMTHVWCMADNSLQIACKGAPEAIAGLCRMNESSREAMHKRINALAAKGIRVLGVASAHIANEEKKFPETPRSFDFRFLGLIGFADPLRGNVRAAVEECFAAGIRVIMITGDYPQTARAIAIQAGITSENAKDNLISGEQLASMTDKELSERCRAAAVFARIMPHQKLRIVQTLKAAGEVVAMTGDGVNDAPALKAAHIGIAMGGRGTDVAREASSIVLLDDDFSSIVRTIRLGRRIYDNLQKAMTYIIAVHIPIAGIAMLPVFLNVPLILTPILIALIEMVIDPMCSIVLEAEPEESNVMSRPPRNPDSPLLPVRLVSWGVFQGIMALIATTAVFFLVQSKQMPGNEVRSLAFLSLIACNIALIFINHSYSTSVIHVLKRYNPLLWGSIIMISAIVYVLFNVQGLSSIAGFAPLTGKQVLIATAPSLVLLVLMEKVKGVWQSPRLFIERNHR